MVTRMVKEAMRRKQQVMEFEAGRRVVCRATDYVAGWRFHVIDNPPWELQLDR